MEDGRSPSLALVIGTDREDISKEKRLGSAKRVSLSPSKELRLDDNASVLWLNGE